MIRDLARGIASIHLDTDVESSPLQHLHAPEPVESLDLDHKSPQLMNQGSRDTKSEKPWDSFPPHIRDCMEQLEKLQKQHDYFESGYHVGYHKLKIFYCRYLKPLFKERMSLLEGNNMDGTTHYRFWAAAMIASNKMLEVTHRDENCLEYLKDIKYTVLNKPKRWKLEFFFYPNPYFTNNVLKKEARFSWFRGRKIYELFEGTEIKWRSGECLTQKIMFSIRKRRLVKANSFFNLFLGREYYADNAEGLRRHIKICHYIIKKVVCLPVFLYMEYMARHYKIAGWNRKNPYLDDSDNKQDQEEYYSMLVAELNAEKLIKFEKNIKRVEGKVLSLKLEALEDVRSKVEPLYDARAEIVAKFFVNGEAMENNVPPFWLNAMRGDEILRGLISDNDAMVLGYLKDIKCPKLDEPNGLKLEFFFVHNPFFENAILTKEMHFAQFSGIQESSNSIGTEIKWRPTFIGNGESASAASFFGLFKGHDHYSEEDRRQDAEICNTIKRRIMPHASSFYLDPRHFRRLV